MTTRRASARSTFNTKKTFRGSQISDLSLRASRIAHQLGKGDLKQNLAYGLCGISCQRCQHRRMSFLSMSGSIYS